MNEVKLGVHLLALVKYFYKYCEFYVNERNRWKSITISYLVNQQLYYCCCCHLWNGSNHENIRVNRIKDVFNRKIYWKLLFSFIRLYKLLALRSENCEYNQYCSVWTVDIGKFALFTIWLNLVYRNKQSSLEQH